MFCRKRLPSGILTAALLAGLLVGCGNAPTESILPENPTGVTATATTTGVTATATTTGSPTRNTSTAPSSTTLPVTTTVTAKTTIATASSVTAEAQTTTSATSTRTDAVTTTTTAALDAGVFTDIHRLQAGKSYTVTGVRLFSVRSTDRAFAKIQGGYFDGETYYIAALRKLNDGYEDVRILVVSKTGELLRESEPLPLDHANNISYNPTLDQLVVTHCQSPDGHYSRFSFVDPYTLTVTETADKSQPFFAMAYSPEKQQYASARWGGETLDFWDRDMHHLQAKSVTPPGSLSQGVFCDGEGVYFVRSSQNGYASELRIYDWDGELKLATPLRLAGAHEPECINIVGDTTYIIADDWRGNAVVYALQCKEE